jgi:hypothetical protein
VLKWDVFSFGFLQVLSRIPLVVLGDPQGCPRQQAWGSGAAMPLPNFAVPNVAFAEPYAHLPQPQQNVTTIGGYAARNMQIIAAIQTNANQMGEGNADIAYEL